jgi:hypothetical protein
MHDTAGWSILLFTAAGVTLVAFAFSKLERSARAGMQPKPVSAETV